MIVSKKISLHMSLVVVSSCSISTATAQCVALAAGIVVVYEIVLVACFYSREKDHSWLKCEQNFCSLVVSRHRSPADSVHKSCLTC